VQNKHSPWARRRVNGAQFQGSERRMDEEIINLSSMYDLLYRRAAQAVAIFNPCRIQGGLCLRGDFCCRECFNLGRNGCTVEALACKVWLCRKAAKARENALCRRILQIIGDIASELRINGYRFSKDENLRAGEQIAVNAERVRRWREKLRECETLISSRATPAFPHPEGIDLQLNLYRV
jgi:hypothetical protein